MLAGVTVPFVRRAAARVVCLAGGRLVLLLRWRDPASGQQFWEPPGGGVERGESFEAAARRELREETGLEAGSLRGPLMVPRDFLWEGERRVGQEAFLLAEWPAPPIVSLEDCAALLGCAWLKPASVAAMGDVEPPGLADVVRRLRTARPSPPSR